MVGEVLLCVWNGVLTLCLFVAACSKSVIVSFPLVYTYHPVVPISSTFTNWCLFYCRRQRDRGFIWRLRCSVQCDGSNALCRQPVRVLRWRRVHEYVLLAFALMGRVTRFLRKVAMGMASCGWGMFWGKTGICGMVGDGRCIVLKHRRYRRYSRDSRLLALARCRQCVGHWSHSSCAM